MSRTPENTPRTGWEATESHGPMWLEPGLLEMKEANGQVKVPVQAVRGWSLTR